jgi:VanZ family protein
MPAAPGFRYYRYWILVGAGLVIAVLLLSLLPLSVDLSEGKDKLSHFLAYGSMMFWFGMLYPAWRRQVQIGLALALMGVGVEYLQRLTGYRSFEVADMIANAVGVLIGWALVQTPLRKILSWVDARLG